MLFDHGSDAMTASLVCMNLSSAWSIGNGYWSFVSQINTVLPFYFATIESFYRGGVFLPIVNGVSDGSVAYVICTIGASVLSKSLI